MEDGANNAIERQITLDGGIEAIEVIYPNNHKVIKLTLSDGRAVVVRELLAEDTEQVYRLANNKEDQAMYVYASLATTFNGESMLFEDIKKLKMKDFNMIQAANMLLNF
jgi:hypothetical protein